MEMMALPGTWAVSSVGDVCEYIQRGKSPKYSDLSRLPVVNQRSIRWHGIQDEYLKYVHEDQFSAWDEARFIQEGDILWNSTGTGTIGRACLVRQEHTDPPKVVDSHVTIVRSNKRIVEPGYLFAWIRGPEVQQKIEDLATGTTNQIELNRSTIASTLIPIAPVNEQRRIAAKLDSTLAAVEACRQRLDGVAAILKRFRQVVLAAATAGELSREWREETGAPAWTIEKASEVCSKVQSGGTPKDGFIDEPGVPFLKVYNLVGQNVDFTYKPQFVRPEAHLGPLAKSRVKAGDVLMNIVGPPLGKVAITPDDYDEWNINQAITLFRPSERIRGRWIYMLLCEGSNIRGIELQTKGSAGQINISLTQCREFKFPIPGVNEQDEIIARVGDIFAFADQLEARLNSARRIIVSLTPALLAKAFRGELVPQDPSDEPASMLLERIRAASNAVFAGSTPLQRVRRKTLNHESATSRVIKTNPLDYSKGSDSMQKSLIEVLEQHLAWISASMACKELGISDGSSSDELESFYRQLKDHVENGDVDVQRRGDEDWLKLTRREVV